MVLKSQKTKAPKFWFYCFVLTKVLNLENIDKTRYWNIIGYRAYTGEGLLEDWLVHDIASRICMLD
ncbi:hypothetical protein LINPERHAP1_LOCUS12307 [Linum perenne]